MSVNAGYATMQVIPSARGFGSQLTSQVSGEVDSAGRGIGRKFGRAFMTAAKIVTAGAVALGGLGVAGATAGIKTASAMEQANVSFTTMLGSGKKANAFLGKLSAFAAKTPFEFPELQTAASSLVSAGVNANKVIPIMTSLGNATAGMGTGSEGIKRATVALQQMQAAGKITGEDLNQLRDAGVPVFDLLAAATGKSKKAVAELANAGKLGGKELAQLMKALETGKGLERFNGLMDKQSQTLSGQFSTLKDTVNMGLAAVVQPWLPFIKQLLGGVSTGASGFFGTLTKKSAELATHGPAIAAFFKNATTGAKALFDLVVKGDFTGGLRTAFGWEEDSPAVDRILDIRDAVVAFMDSIKSGDGLSKLGAAVKGFTGSLPAAGPSLDLLGRGLSFVADHADLVGKALPFVIAGFAAFKAAQAANNVVGKDSLVGMTLQVGSTLTLAASNRTLAASNRQVTTSQVQVTGAENTGLIARARGLIAVVAKSVAEKAAALASRAYAAAQWLVNAALSANPIGLVIIGLVALGAAIVLAWKHSETFRTIVLGAWSAIQVAAVAVFGWLRVVIPAAFAFIKNAFLRYTPLGIVISHWGQIRAFIGAVVSGIRVTIGWFAGLPGKFSSWFGAAKTAATVKLGELVSFMEGVPGKILSAIGNVGDLLKDKGSEIVNGLIRGISDMGGRLASFVKQFVADHIPAPVAKALKISSPSRVMAAQAKWIPLGIIDGIESQRSKLDATMAGLVKGPNLGALPASAVPAPASSSRRREPLDLSEATLQRLMALFAELRLRADLSVNDVDAAMGW